ncbi:hypothetical protein FRX31_032483 [Thalictrum thalictroides]|uniref:Uncharacterized protein n=1 Tax=Thalictrum thalictroides TaxID=46969 RepID=A0A7J6V0N4_THATH|nr:hypothetical protein FRX31_032483 [Thalictrum thalictroides]
MRGCWLIVVKYKSMSYIVFLLASILNFYSKHPFSEVGADIQKGKRGTNYLAFTTSQGPRYSQGVNILAISTEISMKVMLDG